MEKLYILDPEVAGGWGPGTVITNQMQLDTGLETVPEVAYLEYRFDGWLGDELIAFISTFIITDRLAEALEHANITGVHFQSVSVCTSDVWEQLRLSVELPRFCRLIPKGNVRIQNKDKIVSWTGHDICWGTRIDFVKPKRVELLLNTPAPYGLIVTERCLEVLKNHHIEHCTLEELVWPQD